jgi:hypothetical protein
MLDIYNTMNTSGDMVFLKLSKNEMSYHLLLYTKDEQDRDMAKWMAE